MPATQTLRASAAGYCEDAAGVQFALDSTESGVVYQLYRDNAPLSGATLTDSGSAATFSGTFTAGVYRVESLPGATCPVAMDGTHTITMYPVPAPPAITGPEVACNTATLVAVPGDHGNGILWTNDDSTNPARIVTTSDTYTAMSTSAYDCQSSPSSFVCDISYPSAAGAAPDPLCCCQCGLTNVNNKCATVNQTTLPVLPYYTCNATGRWANAWSSDAAILFCKTTQNCKNLHVRFWHDYHDGWGCETAFIGVCVDARCSYFSDVYRICEGTTYTTRCWN
jgi:hypothetical protein